MKGLMLKLGLLVVGALPLGAAASECIPMNDLSDTELYCPVNLEEGQCSLSVHLADKEPEVMSVNFAQIRSRFGQFRGQLYLTTGLIGTDNLDGLDPYFITIQAFRSTEGRYLFTAVSERWEKFDEDYDNYDKRTTQLVVIGPNGDEEPVLMTRNETHIETDGKSSYPVYESDLSVNKNTPGFDSAGSFNLEHSSRTGQNFTFSCDL